MSGNVFFEGLKRKVFFETEKGELSLYDIFDLSMDELINIYKELKTKVFQDDDEIIGMVVSKDGDNIDKLKYDIIKEVVLYKKEIARKNELIQKKKQLENMLAEIKIKQLSSNPELLEEEIKKINEQLKEY